MDPAAAKQQIVERVRQASNLLVTVSTNPTVDQLAACIGLTLLLNKMDKHATAVFSGAVPSTIEFLQPEKTLETNTDSLRDFIISLDKNKADKLRYKVEDEVVKIFITPYKTSLSEKDLVFSQGDFNVEVVVALGIKDRSQIDAAITAHGRILHDATVISLNSGADKAPSIGQINWQDVAASSLCEMLTSVSEAFGANLIDNQIATAFLTGIVAETNRFSNNKTSPKVMTMSAQLMAAGANQQLIVSKLDQQAPALAKPAQPPAKASQPQEMSPDGTLSVRHDVEAKLKETDKAEPSKEESDEIHIDEQGNLQPAGNLIKPIEEPKEEPAKKDDNDKPQQPQSPLQAVVSTSDEPTPKAEEPTTAPPADEMPGSHTLLNPSNKQPFMESAFTANTQPEWQDPYESVPLDPLAGSGAGGERILDHKKVVKPLSEETAAKAQTTSPVTVDNARNAVESALAQEPFDPALKPEKGLGAINLGELSHESSPAVPANGTPSLPLPGQPAYQAPTDKGIEDNTPSANQLAAPPPIPPPLLPTQGVISPSSVKSNKK